MTSPACPDGPYGGAWWLDADDEPEPEPCPRCGWERAYPEPEPCVVCGFGDPDEEEGIQP